MERLAHRGLRFLVFSAALSLLVSGLALIERNAVSAQTQPPAARWTSTGAPTFQHTTLARLHNGRVLAVGGSDLIQQESNYSKVELYEPLTGRWRDTAPMNVARYDATPVLLADGRLLMLGGWKFIGPGIPPAPIEPPELFDPVTETWSLVTFNGPAKSFFYGLFPVKPTVTPLPNGQFLLVSGVGGRAALLDPASRRFEEIAEPANSDSGHSTVLLPNNKVLYLTAIPDRESGFRSAVRAELFDVATRTWRATAVPLMNGTVITGGRLAGLLPDGKVLGIFIRAELGDSGQIVRSQISAVYDPQTERWADYVESPSTAIPSATVVLANGEVLALAQNDVPWIYNPAQKTWRASFPAISPKFTPLLLPDGQAFTGKELYGFDFGASPPAQVVNTSAASFRVEPLARASIVSAFGPSLSDSTALDSVSVSLRDQQGRQFAARVFAVTPNQINYEMPAGLAEGQAEVTIRKSSNGAVARGLLSVVGVATGLFTANGNGQGVPAAVVLRVKADGSQSYEAVAEYDPAQRRFVSRPIELGAESDQVFLLLFGCGWRNRAALENVQVYFGETKADTLYAGKQPDSTGLDQINARIPRNLAGRGEVELYITVDGKLANPVKVQIK
jgi:uncharacterized protein (TIGR03437 family)